MNKMNLNPNYEVIGKSFVQQYYAMLDNNDTRLQVANFYSVSAPVTDHAIVLIAYSNAFNL